MTDREADLSIPQRVQANWRPAGGPRHLRRQLTLAERARIEGRRAELSEALAPLLDEELDAADAAIGAMLAGFRALRSDADRDEDVAVTVRIIRHVVAEFPAWAIQKGCLRIARNEAGLDRRYAPNDSEIHQVVAQVVAPYRDRLRAAEELLAAPIEADEPRAIPGRTALPPPQPLPVRSADSSHALRVLADIESRRPKEPPPVPPATEAA